MSRDSTNGTTDFDAGTLTAAQRQLLRHHSRLNNTMQQLVVDMAGMFVQNPDNLRTASDDRPKLHLVCGGVK